MDRERAFVLAHTTLALVPLVPELSVYTATEVTPLWQATEAWLSERDVAIPFWSVPWAGGQGLARYVLDHPDLVKGRRVLDFACGGGLVGIAAAKAGAHVLAVDIDSMAIAATLLNAEANGVTLDATCEDLVGQALDFELILAGDIFYEREAAERFTSWLRKQPGRVLTGDPGRWHVPDAPELARYEVPTPLELESKASKTTRVLDLTRRT